MRTEELIQKYNRAGPRYTSYPPVPFWSNRPDETKWLAHLKSQYKEKDGVDLYVHVPFCEKLCYYCGCSRIITKDHGVEDAYLKTVLKEWDMYRELLGYTPRINSLHFGGGTPTFLSPKNLRRLINHLTTERMANLIGSIEIDPRTCTTEHLHVLAEAGISRVSLGIQDFDPVVQSTINRQQPVSMVQSLMIRLRELKFKSVNFDLIYGLPKQTLESIAATIGLVTEMRPDLVAFYGYAHLPERIRNQRLIKPTDLPDAELRKALYESGKKDLAGKGYDDIGMDHFALPGSYLHAAKINKSLHRNFMGYVDKKSSVMIGLGPTSISDSGISFSQNAKDLKDYQQKVEAGHLPIENGHTHSEDDLHVQRIILQLMCEGETIINRKHIPDWESVKADLLGFQSDGILNLNDGKLVLSEMGKPFVRNVAMAFDFHLRNKESNIKFSQTI